MEVSFCSPTVILPITTCQPTAVLWGDYRYPRDCQCSSLPQLVSSVVLRVAGEYSSASDVIAVLFFEWTSSQLD